MPYQFVFRIDGEVHFQTEVESVQCMELCRNGARCSRKTVIASPFCWTHLRSKHHLRVKPSTLPNAGKGLFADRPGPANDQPVFKKGANIVKYYGEKISRAQMDERYNGFTGPYLIGLTNTQFEDGAKRRGVGSLANRNPGHNNANISVHRGAATIRATRNIYNGQEIFCAYGPSYHLDEPGITSATVRK